MNVAKPQPVEPEAVNHYDKPVAYDANGQPLYARPQPSASPQVGSMVGNVPAAYQGESFDPRLRKQYANEPGIVHAARPIEPPELEISPQLAALHKKSV